MHDIILYPQDKDDPCGYVTPINACSRYVKYRARVSALALDPAVQGIVYCGIFMLMPLSLALVPLLLKESVYLLWVMKEVLQIAAPG